MACLRLSSRTARIDIAIARNCCVGKVTYAFPRTLDAKPKLLEPTSARVIGFHLNCDWTTTKDPIASPNAYSRYAG